MKFLRVAFLGIAFSPFCLAVNKDIVALQRDLEAKLDAMQQTLNSKLDVLTGTLQAIQNDSRRTAEQVATLQDNLGGSLAKSLTPVNNLNSRVDAMGEDTRALRDSLADLTARLERMDAKITDLKNQLQIMQNPPSAPGAAPTGMPGPSGSGVPSGAGAANGPPPGMSAEATYGNARKDQQTGNVDLAAQEYQQYLQYYPNTELAASAQYYLGEIAFNKGDYKNAVSSFDAVLERYPNNPKTSDARYMKGMALAKDGQRLKAIQELRSLVQANPNSEQARKATQALRDTRLFPPASSVRRSSR